MVISITAGSREEAAYANNEFTLYLGGSDPLHFIQQPEDVTAQEGEDVSFSVEVGGGKRPYTYQWQIWDEKHQKWVDLPGFTDPTMSRGDIEKKRDGCKFRCIVTDAAGTQIISQVVTLTVRDRVPTGDNTNLPLYLAVAMIALLLLMVMPDGSPIEVPEQTAPTIAATTPAAFHRTDLDILTEMRKRICCDQTRAAAGPFGTQWK